jgi:hypothetical protein
MGAGRGLVLALAVLLAGPGGAAASHAVLDGSLRGVVTLPTVVAAPARPEVRVELTHPDGRPASDLAVRAELFYGFARHARVALAAEAPGVYAGRLPVDGVEGLWQGVVRVEGMRRPLIADIALTVRRETPAPVAAAPRRLGFRPGGPWTPRPWLDHLVGVGLFGGLVVAALALAARPWPAPRPQPALSLPAWLVAVGIAGALAGPLGAYWDVAWHVDAGRETFWSPPHLMIYGGILAVIVSVLAAAGLAEGGVRRAARGHRGLAFSVVAGAVTLASAPLDEGWHRLFGLDVSIWSPPHLLLLFGSAFAMLGLALVHADRLPGLAARLSVVMLAAAALLIVGIFVLEFEFRALERWHVLLARPRGLYPAAATALAVLVLAAVARAAGPGAATAAAVSAFVLRVLVSLVLLPALGRSAPLAPPVYPLPALALDLALVLLPRAWAPGRRFAVAGAVATTLAYLVHNPAATLLAGRVVTAAELWSWFPVALVAGAAAAFLGLRIGMLARPAPAGVP